LITLLVASLALYAGVKLGEPAGWSLAGAGAILLAVRLFAFVRRRHRPSPELAQVDAMDGWEFEAFIAELLTRQGWHVELTPGSGDLGVDLIAEKAGERWAIQVKRQDAPVSRRAVSDAVAGRDHYGCTEAMVVTNATFTRGAELLAESTGCELVERDDLEMWIRDNRPGQT
jgi:restriction system protein